MTAIDTDFIRNWVRGKELWEDYSDTHDTGPFAGQLAGVDVESGAVYFGHTAEELEGQRVPAAGGIPLWVTRVDPPGLKRHRSMWRVPSPTDAPGE